MALVMTLIFATAVTGASVAFIGTRQSDTLSMRAQLEAVQAQAVLDAALVQAATLIANWQERKPLPEQFSWSFEGAQMSIRLESEAGKVDLNAAEEALLQALLLALELSEREAKAFADTVIDWRDENDARRANGAEDRDYGRSAIASGAADRPFAHPAELRYLPPVDATLWSFLAPYVTIYTGQAMPERRKAAPIVRQAMLIARGLAPSGTMDDDTSGLSPNGEQADDAQPDDAQPVDKTRRFRRVSRSRDGSTDGEDATLGEAADTDNAAEDPVGIFTLRLDVKLPSGYEAAAWAVVSLAAGGQEPFTILDWTPFIREPSNAS